MFFANKPERFLGQVVANGHCVRYCQHVSNVPHTSQWRRGRKVRNGHVEAGTIIATFHDQTGRYENDVTGKSHAAVFIVEHPNGLEVYDQWVGQPVKKRIIHFRRGIGSKANDGDAYYVVMDTKK